MSDTHEAQMDAIARRFIAAVSAGDVDAVAEIYHDEVGVWRNIDNRTLVKRQALKVVRFLAGAVTDLRYEDLRIQPTATGYVQQHRLCGVTAKGEQLGVAACLVVRVEGGQIVGIEEYLDSRALAPLM